MKEEKPSQVSLQQLQNPILPRAGVPVCSSAHLSAVPVLGGRSARPTFLRCVGRVWDRESPGARHPHSVSGVEVGAALSHVGMGKIGQCGFNPYVGVWEK